VLHGFVDHALPAAVYLGEDLIAFDGVGDRGGCVSPGVPIRWGYLCLGVRPLDILKEFTPSPLAFQSFATLLALCEMGFRASLVRRR
jgi:hypothetical protein